MSFLDCINTAAQTGRLKQAKAEEAATAYEEAKAEGLAQGLGEAAAEAAAAQKAVEATTTLVAAKRWERINSMKKEHEIHTLLYASAKPTSALAGHNIAAPIDNLSARIDFTYASVTDQIMAHLDGVISKFDSKFLGLVKPLENMDNMIRALYGESVEPAAKVLGEQYAQGMEFMRKMLNLEGASIRENENHRAPQSHDRLAVREAGKEVWVNDHLKDGVLDWDVMEYQGKDIPVDQRRTVLERVWDAIVSEGTSTEKGAYGSQGLTARLARQRFLYYKTADSWLEMNGKYGKGNAYNQLLSQVEMTARNVALMRHLGPNPENGAAFAKRTLENIVGQKTLTLGVKAGEKLRTELGRELKAFDDAMAIQMQKVDMGEGDALVQMANSARSLIGTSMLGGMLSTSLGDVFYGMWFRQIYHLPFVTQIPKMVHALLNFKDFKQQLLNSGIGLESATRMMHDSQRYTLAAEGSHFARMVSEANYRATGTAHWTEAGRGLAGLDFADALGKQVGKNFDDIPFVELMRNVGITEADWNAVRDTPLYEPEYYSGGKLFGKAQHLRPIDMFSGAGSNAGREAANKFLMLQELFIRGSLPISSTRSRALIGGAVSPRSIHGQMVRSMAQFMVMPASTMFTHWRLAMAAPTAVEKAYRFGMLMAYTTAAGALIEQIKEVLQNRSLANMDPIENPQFWLRAMVLGGGGAILGDFIYNNLAAAGGPFSGSNPTVQFGKKLAGAVIEPVKWALGDENAHVARAEMEAAWALLPKPQPFRFAMERMMYDPLLEHVDPAAYARKRAKELEVLGTQGQDELINFQ